MTQPRIDESLDVLAVEEPAAIGRLRRDAQLTLNSELTDSMRADAEDAACVNRPKENLHVLIVRRCSREVKMTVAGSCGHKAH
jgi:hypothetical protein